MDDVAIARLRRIKLPHPHHTEGRGDGNFPPSNAPLRRLSLIGEQKERYVFTRSSANRPKATREVLPTGYKSFFRSLKQKHGFRDRGADSAFGNLRVTLPDVNKRLRHRHATSPSHPTVSPSAPHPTTDQHRNHPHHHRHHEADLGHYYVGKLRARDHSSAEATAAAEELLSPKSQRPQHSPCSPHDRRVDQASRPGSGGSPGHHHHHDSPHDDDDDHHPRSPCGIDKEALLAEIAGCYLGPGESPEGSPQLRQRRAMNPEVSEKESLALVGLTDAEEEHGHGGKRRAGEEGSDDDASRASRASTPSRPKRRERDKLQDRQADNRHKMELLLALLVPALDKVGPWRAWKQWRHVVSCERDSEFKWGWREVSKEEACFLFQRRYTRLRKGHLRRALLIWYSHVDHLKKREKAKEVHHAKVVIYRAVRRWYKELKIEKARQKAQRIAAKKQADIAQVLRFEKEAKKLRAIHHYNKAQSRLEHVSAIVIQKTARRHIAMKHAKVQRRRKTKAEWRYREWRRQYLAACAIRRAYFRSKGWRIFNGRVAVRLAARLKFEKDTRAAKSIQKAWHSLVDWRQGRILLARKRVEKAQHLASKMIAEAWHNAMDIRWPINRRADARQRRNAIKAAHYHARVIQTAYRKHHNYGEYLARRNKERDRRRRMPGAATIVACWYRRHFYRTIFAKQLQGRLQFLRWRLSRLAMHVVRSRIQKQRHAAAATLQLFWYKCQANEEAAERLQEKKRLLEEERRRKEELRRRQANMATRIQRAYRGHVCRYQLHRRVMLRIEAMRPRHEAAVLIQKNFKKFKEDSWLRARFEERKRRMELARLNRFATVIQTGYRGYRARYYAPSRLIIRRQMEIKRRQEAAARLQKKRSDAATRIQRWYRRCQAWRALFRRFRQQKQRMEKGKAAKHKEDMARRIQVAWYRVRGRRLLLKRFRDRKAAMAIQRAWRKHRNWKLLEGRFIIRRKALDVQNQLAADKIKAEEEEAAAQAARKAAEDELALKISRSWKLGADSYGRNYYYNWITGESSWDKPESWQPLPEETWIKNVDDRGNTYYYHILTGESRWLPPCTICFSDAQRFCVDCDLTFCTDHFLDYHEAEDKKDHEWRGADTDKDILQAGEVFCIECRRKAAKKVCKICRDPYCDRCFEQVHRSGWLSGHKWVSYSESKKGWQVVPGRIAGEPPYYFNSTTGESTYEKPRELMLEEELAEHDKFMKAKEAAERYAKRIEQLQMDLETLQYQVDLKWAEDQEKEKEAEEMRRELEHLRKMQKNFWDALLDNILPWRVYLRTRQSKADDLVDYRKRLLITRKDREKAGVVLGQDKKDKAAKKNVKSPQNKPTSPGPSKPNI